ncbi:hypothetical protein ACSVBT_04835 [Afipia sp. TerB]
MGGVSAVAMSLALGRIAAAEPAAGLADLDFANAAGKEHAAPLAGVPRYVRHEVFGDPAGIMIEDAAVNGVEDAGYSQAAVPRGWRMPAEFNPASPCTATFTKAGNGRGLLRLQGDSAGEFHVVLGSGRHFPIAAGDALTGSMAIRLAQGASNNLKGVSLVILENDGEGRVANKTPPTAPIQQLQADKAWWAEVRAVAGAYRYANLAIKVVAGAAFDLTFEINHPQLEKRNWRSTFCVASREADRISLAAALQEDYLSGPERSLVLTADMPRFSANGTLWSEQGDDKNFIAIERQGWFLNARVVKDGASREIRLGVVSPLMRFSVALAIGESGLTASLNGKPPIVFRGAMPRGLSMARLGSGVAGSWNSTIQRLTLYRGRIIDCARASRLRDAFFDDFDRPDSASLGVSPTGQSIIWFGTATSRIAEKKWVADAGSWALAHASYGKVTLPAIPRYMGAVLNWTSGREEGGAGLLAVNGDLPNPIDALHTIVCDNREIFQTITSSTVDAAVANFYYPVPMKRDGTTVYGVARLLNIADKAVVFVGPDGDLARHVHETYVSRAGRNAVFEHYWQIGQCRPEFLAVAAL